MLVKFHKDLRFFIEAHFGKKLGGNFGGQQNRISVLTKHFLVKIGKFRHELVNFGMNL